MTTYNTRGVGNITCGYLGTAAGFSEKILLMGGYAAADGVKMSPSGILKGIDDVISSANSDTDKNNIMIGVNWYNSR